MPFMPYHYQRRLLTDRSPKRLVLKARQTGLSQTVGIEARHAAEHEPETTTLLISRNQDLAGELIRYARLCSPERPDNPIVKDNSFGMQFANCSRVMAQPATRNAGRGIPARRVYLDEFAFVEYAEDIWASVEPTAQIITVLSTPNGRTNLFYLMWAGELGEWSKHLIHWSDCPRYWTDAEKDAGVPAAESAWYRSKRDFFTKRDWASEFECDFVESGGAVFPSELCQRVYKSAGLPNGDPRTWIEAPNSITYWDLGARQDATVGVTVSKIAGRLPVIAFARYEAPNEWPDMERAIADRCARYPDGRHFVESNGIGDPFISHLREKGLPIEEFLVTARSKTDIIRALTLACEQDRFRHGSHELYTEMLRYEIDDTKLVQDCVMATSGAVYLADQAGVLLHI
jgi:hypothetical protein